MTTLDLPIQLNTISQMTTCTQAVISWSYHNTSAGFSSMSLFIANLNIIQPAPPSSSGSSSTVASRTSSPSTTGATTILANTILSISKGTMSSTTSASESAVSLSLPSLLPQHLIQHQFDGFNGTWLPQIRLEPGVGLDPTIYGFTWTSVSVPQGWYVLQAEFSRNVVSGNAHGTESVMGSSTCTAAPSAPGSPTAVVSRGAASSSHSRLGAIVGAALGGVTIQLALAAALYFLLHRCQRFHQQQTA